MTDGDLDAVVAVAATAFPDHPESRACFAERLALSPTTCLALADDEKPARGYLIAYPWPFGEIPPLDTLIGALPAGCDTLYLHDLALAPEAIGHGLTRPAIDTLMARATGHARIALVSVNGSVPFWQRHGFAVVESPDLTTKLRSYGPDARYMVRQL
ncbi:GNAT family N-acetyltransferase [Sphingomonas naphthae]|uniref:GNAT family N-acetyltransferase n=1 Tax=Sphingomonas naphthae TaxID=1813468 RepID=A0ABY7TP17_9SPHN|nr:GNAT family N-acetyltransferase [Sphingomonas naphthae]WCT74988.1 GNAT family N-acetyltransferase [Sphingomonas naphthae]